MRPRCDRGSDDDSDDDVMSEFTSEISRLRRKGSHADLELEWSVISWETGSQGEACQIIIHETKTVDEIYIFCILHKTATQNIHFDRNVRENLS